MRKIGYGFLLGKLGFRGLFVVIGALFSLAFLAVALPPLLVRWEAMQAADSRLERNENSFRNDEQLFAEI